MAFGKLLILLAVAVTVYCNYQHEVETETKAKKALAPEKEQKSRSANPGRERGSFQKLSSLMNRTDERRQNRRQGKSNLNKIYSLNREHKNQNENMMNDNEGALAVNQKTVDNDTDSLADKMKELKSREGPTYEAVNKHNYVPLGTGVYCNFENETNVSYMDLCMWQWNTTVSSHGLGFKVVSSADLVHLNASKLKFSGPATDADGNVGGHFLYLAVDPTMENMVIKSPPFRGLREFCKFEAYLHQSKMQDASIRLVSESTMSEVQWVLQEVTGNNVERWSQMLVMIGKMQQEVRIIIEITRPSHVNMLQPLPHIAVDNIRMVECLPEPAPFSGGPCQPGQLKCRIMNRESCIKLQQVCDLVRDCDDGMDENQNCDKMPFGSYCNFEQDSCGFENVPQPILKWSRHFGPTPTDKTGPNYDHTCGLPDPYPPTPLIPPLSPAHLNHSLTQCVGYYFFVNMNVTGPNNETAGFASTAVMKTVIFNPPPKVHGNITSKYYNCCMVRFYYQQNGRNYGSLSVELVELTPRGNITTSLWFSTKNKGENWYRAAIFLPNVTRHYYLEFKTRMGMRIYSDSAIDDFSMAPECFGLNIDPEELGDYNYYDPVFQEFTTPHRAFVDVPYYRFTTCGATGRFGPTQEMCDAAYNNTPVSVEVISQKPHQGIQAWKVPEEGLYTIIATGASGGLGSAWTGVSYGAQVRGLFELHRGQIIYMLIGQQGENACKKTLSAQESQECSLKRHNESAMFTSKTHEVRNTDVVDGGGGGGGGTFVFIVDKDGQKQPLVVAGGGGGISVGNFRDDGSQHGRPPTNYSSPPDSLAPLEPLEPGPAAGAGGGWSSRRGAAPGAAGAALSAGAVGGVACAGAAHGGFGGGGGGCLRGGGGGGWLGGSTSAAGAAHGGGGASLVARAALALPPAPPAHRAVAAVLVIPAVYSPQLCGCDYRCVAVDEFRHEVTCYCPNQWTTDQNNNTKCILEDSWPRISWLLVIPLSVAVFVLVLFLMCFCLYLYNGYQRKKEASVRQKALLEQEVQLHRLRAGGGGGADGVVAFNPHYGSESFLPAGVDVRGLPQVARDTLKLLKALGQGAFGEVYQGLYRHRAGDSEMPVAVKTLPELSTGQAESDFLMEAAIMAKFNHPNIVHLIGVCFDRHPRFIVLELLAGGDLKNFLRESRPKPERASALTMKDLLLCSLDVCKGCRYLESQRFIHRDIAARNCLLTSRGPGRVVKIADFGMARDIYRADYYKKGGKAMLPIKWMPPEAYIDGVFTSKTDVWSFGVLVWEVFSLGVMPYTGCANREVMEMVSGGGRLDKPYGCPQEVYRLMCECWNPNPLERPTFAHMFDRLQTFLQDPEIITAPLPVVRALLPVPAHTAHLAHHAPPAQSAPCDYLVPMTTAAASPDANSSMDQLVPHSKTQTAAQVQSEMEDSPFPPLLKASQDYGNIPMASRGGGRRDGNSVTSGNETRSNTKFLPSKSTDRLISSVERTSIDDSGSDTDDRPLVWETSFTEPRSKSNSIDVKKKDQGPAVDKLISITPTSPKPPENVLSKAIDASVIDKTNKNTLMPEKKTAPIASPDPPRIKAWNKEPPKLTPKPKPLCLDAAQLEQNLNALKKNSGSVNLTTMNIVPPYINVVTPNKRSESKTIQIDPKKAVIHDLQSPKEAEVNDEKPKLRQSNSAASLLNGPMTDVPYADSDNASSSSGSNAQNAINNQKNKIYVDVNVGEPRSKVTKQTSNGEFVGESEISC